MTTKEQLLADLNGIRATQKSLKDFNSVSEWLAYGRMNAIRKGKIFEAMEIACR